MDALSSPTVDDGVLRRSQLVAEGFTDGEIRAAIRGGHIERLCRGAVSAPITGPTRFEAAYERYRRLIEARAVGLHAGVVSHASAAALHGLPLPQSVMAEVEATVSRTYGGRVVAGLHLHPARLRTDEIVDIGGLRVTSVPRTVVDLARSLPGRDAVAAADFALHERLVTPESLRAAIESSARRPGMAAARRALLAADGRSESVGESHLRLVTSEIGLPLPQLQVVVRDAAGRFVARCDGADVDCALLVEFDGLEKYGRLLRPGETAADAVVREKRREEALGELGFVVLRVMWADFRDRVALRKRLLRAMERGRKNFAAGLVTGKCQWSPAIGVAPRRDFA